MRALGSTHRHEGRVGAHREVVAAADGAYGTHTFVTPLRCGVDLPSERFAGAECVTKAEWERRHALTYSRESAS